VLKSVGDEGLMEAANSMVASMRADPIFRDVATDAQMKGLQAQLNIDRDKANSLGVRIQDIRTALYSTFGDRQVSTIFTSHDSYPVILIAADTDRRDESAFAKVYVRGGNGALVPLSSIATVERRVGPVAINHAGQLQAITITFNLAAGAALGEAAKKMERFKAEAKMPSSVLTQWAGDAAAFEKSQASQIWLLVSALLVIYVLLGVLYESYIHPITILAGIPSAAIGALITLWALGIGPVDDRGDRILMLVGIVKKNAIMMIDFALNAQREEGMDPAAAIRQACVLRFRPIMMTTLCALMGAIPIAAGLGAGAELRQPLGLAVVGGLSSRRRSRSSSRR
jgi:HAE1 family hydrophobic/amphiphilic exporter-1